MTVWSAVPPLGSLKPSLAFLYARSGLYVAALMIYLSFQSTNALLHFDLSCNLGCKK